MRKPANPSPPSRVLFVVLVPQEFCSGSGAAEKLGVSKSDVSAHVSGRIPGLLKGKYLLRFKHEDGIRGIRGVSKAVEQITATREVIARFDSCTDASRRLGVPGGTIGRVCNGRQSEVRGLLFRWATSEAPATETVAKRSPRSPSTRRRSTPVSVRASIPASDSDDEEESDGASMDVDGNLPELEDFLADIGLSEYMHVLEDEDFTLPLMIASLNDKKDVNGWLLANLIEMGMSRQKCRRLIRQLRGLPGVRS